MNIEQFQEGIGRSTSGNSTPCKLYDDVGGISIRLAEEIIWVIYSNIIFRGGCDNGYLPVGTIIGMHVRLHRFPL